MTTLDAHGRGTSPASARARVLVAGVVLLGGVAVALIASMHRGDPDRDRVLAAPADPTAPGTMLVELEGAGSRRPLRSDAKTEPATVPQTARPVNRASSERPGRTEPTTTDRPAPRTHVVRRGETLRGLARTYYDDAERWREIQRANGLTGTVIQAGQELRIP